METMSISQFKATCLQVIENIRKNGGQLLITKNGNPAAILSAPPAEVESGIYGVAKDEITFIGDVITPLDSSDWEALK